MKGIFILPEKEGSNAYELINEQVKHNLPLNIGLVFDKYVNKFVIGYYEDGEWIEGKQSNIKRQIYLLRKERIEVIERLKNLRNKKGKEMVSIKRKKIKQKRIGDIISPIIDALEECDVEKAIESFNKNIKGIQNREFLQELKGYIKELYKINLALHSFNNDLYLTFHNRLNAILNNFKMRRYSIEDDLHEVKWRLIINLGAASVYETSLLLHRNYSIPYIPGSAIKGVTRHWAIQKFAEEFQKRNNVSYEYAVKEISTSLENGKELEMKVDDIEFKELVEIFGGQDKKGRVIFFDAMPVIDEMDKSKEFIILDIMNVHYKPYYEKAEIPGDWHDPVPVFFLAVEKGIKFRFVMASKNKKLVMDTKKLLTEALENLGIGAKTSSGYGLFG